MCTLYFITKTTNKKTMKVEKEKKEKKYLGTTSVFLGYFGGKKLMQQLF